MIAEPQNIDLTPQHERWLAVNNAHLICNDRALQDWAMELDSPIDDKPLIQVGPDQGLRPSTDVIAVNWLAPAEPLRLAEHQLQLTSAVGLALVKIRREVQRRTMTAWGGIVFAAGMVAGGTGELTHNTPTKITGVVALCLGLGAVSWVNFRGEPKAPSLEGLHVPPLQLELNA